MREREGSVRHKVLWMKIGKVKTRLKFLLREGVQMWFLVHSITWKPIDQHLTKTLNEKYFLKKKKAFKQLRAIENIRHPLIHKRDSKDNPYLLQIGPKCTRIGRTWQSQGIELDDGIGKIQLHLEMRNSTWSVMCHSQDRQSS